LEFDEALGYWSIHCSDPTNAQLQCMNAQVLACVGSCDACGTDRSMRRTAVYHARAVVAADGAMSSVARSIGIVHELPNTLCSRTFAKVRRCSSNPVATASSDCTYLLVIQPGTHNFGQLDHVIFYPRKLLPGFVIMTRELEDYLSICFYIMPGRSLIT
jgi:hypothetical protein